MKRVRVPLDHLIDGETSLLFMFGYIFTVDAAAAETVLAPRETVAVELEAVRIPALAVHLLRRQPRSLE